jgi:hypothetical protein
MFGFAIAIVFVRDFFVLFCRVFGFI